MTNIFKTSPLYLDKARSLMQNNYRHVTGINHGRIYPIDHFRVQPGDTIIQSVNAIIRGATPLAQVMSNSSLELYAFFVPDHIIWNHTKQFFGENETAAWTQTIGYKKPKAIWTTSKTAIQVAATDPQDNSLFTLKASDNKFYSIPLGEDCFFNKNKIASYLGINPGFTASELKTSYDNNKNGPAIATNFHAIRSYWQIWNDYFRDENYCSPIVFNKGDLNFNVCDQTLPYSIKQVSSQTAKPSLYDENGSNVLFAFKKQDSFTTVLPEPTKGPQINLLALGQQAPVFTGPAVTYPSDNSIPLDMIGTLGNSITGKKGMALNAATTTYTDQDMSGISVTGGLKPKNLWADLTAAGSLTIEAIRLAAATTQYYEALARGGSRFNEAIRALFGVTPADNSIQRAEYLGGNQVALTQYQVAQTAPNNSGADLGKIGAFSYTNHTTNLIRKSFDVWGTVMIVAVARVEHEYSNAIDPDDLTEDILDEYFPQFDGIGDQPIDKEIMNVGTRAFYYGGGETDKIYSPTTRTWGFQEAWWYKRFRHSRTSGIMNVTNPNALTYWTYSEPYFNPYTSNNVNWLLAIEDEQIVDRTLQLGAFASALAQQLICNFEFKQTKYTIMRARSIPGITRI